MYGLPEQFDGSFLVGRTLEFITFAQYSVAFAFDGSVAISVESSLQHDLKSDAEDAVVQSVPLAESRLMRLLGRHVLRATGDTSGTLTLAFDDGQVLRVFDDQQQYESYSLYNGKHRTIV